MSSNHTPALFEYSSRINRFSYLRNKGNHIGKKEPYKVGAYRMGVILGQTHADEFPEPSEKSLCSNKIYLKPSVFAHNMSREEFAASGMEAGASASFSLTTAISCTCHFISGAVICHLCALWGKWNSVSKLRHARVTSRL